MYTQTHGTPANTRRSSGYTTCTHKHTATQKTPDVRQGTPHVHPDTRLPRKHQTFIRVRHVYTQTHGTPANTRRSSRYTTCTHKHTATQKTPDVRQGTPHLHPDTRLSRKHQKFIRVRHVYTQTHGTPENTRRSSGYATCAPRHTAPQQTPHVHQGTIRVHPDTRHPNKHYTFTRVRHVYTQTHGTQQTPDVHHCTARVHPDTRHPSKHQTSIRVHQVHTQTHSNPSNTRRSSEYTTCTPRHTTPQQTLDVHQGTPSAHTNTRHPNKH